MQQSTKRLQTDHPSKLCYQITGNGIAHLKNETRYRDVQSFYALSCVYTAIQTCGFSTAIPFIDPISLYHFSYTCQHEMRLYAVTHEQKVRTKLHFAMCSMESWKTEYIHKLRHTQTCYGNNNYRSAKLIIYTVVSY